MAASERRQARQVAAELERVVERLMTKVTLDVDANLRESTPVDTGWARANWVPRIGAPYVADLGNVRPGPQDVASAAATAAQGQASVLGYSLARGRIYVSNNVPYISRLNAGHSKQAPSGFVQRAISKALTVDIRSFRG